MPIRRVVGSSFAVVLFASLVACGSKSSAADPATTDDANQTETPGVADGDAAPAPAAAAQQPPPSDAPPPATDGGAPEADGDAGAASTGTGAPPAPNPQCQAASVHESGSNDTAATANAIPAASGSFCGSLDSASDVDFVTFTLPANATSLGFGLSYSRLGVVIEGTAGGESFMVGGKPAFKPGQKYVLEVHSSGMTPVDYLLTVDIK
jgi:hypothetical protein